MKGQVNIEFILSVAIFIIVIATLSFNIINTVPLFHAESANEIKKSKSFQVSELLVKDTGYPPDWHLRGIENADRLGLRMTNGDQSVLDWDKVTTLSYYCSPGTGSYDTVVEKLGLNAKDRLLINITDLNGQSVMECFPPAISEKEPIFWIYRFGLINGWIVRIKVAVY